MISGSHLPDPAEQDVEIEPHLHVTNFRAPIIVSAFIRCLEPVLAFVTEESSFNACLRVDCLMLGVKYTFDQNNLVRT
ncbi:hypothetical protein Hypma_008329 [Hypsizygus marmoreus]|uniref:Uncharacterized protein n=1 Tax=Hypsizygus marmoreus TaxID=39966 RepID=A0A369JRV3_HYPMA|nr:hypothetical protein Hypma_008329 [Hypsizygus marmoreus]